MFKVGDKVRIVKNNECKSMDCIIGLIGFIESISNESKRIIIKNKEFGSIRCCEDELELVNNEENKFKIGDRVKILKNIGLSCFGNYVGKIGTIKTINETGIKYTVIMDNPTLKNVKWNEDELELISSSKFKVGDRVKRISGNHMCGMKTGDIGTVAEVNINLIRLKEYENWYHFESKFVKINDSFKTNKVTVQDKIDKLREQKLKIENEINKLSENIEYNVPNKIVNEIIEEHNKEANISFIVRGTSVYCYIKDDEGKLISKGISKLTPGDTFDVNIGSRLAYHRAIISYNNKKQHEIIRNTFKENIND